MDAPTAPLPPLQSPPPPPAATPPAPAEPPSRGETARSSALWLGGTGAFLLLAAAAVLVAMRWDDIAAWAKVAGLVSVNLGVLWTSFRLERGLPATARSLYGLGGLLIPVSIVAIGLNSNLDVSWLALSASGFSAASLLALHRIRPMPLLESVGLAAIVPLAGAGGALLGLPGPLLLGAAAVGAAIVVAPHSRSVRHAAIGWAAVAAGAPLIVAFNDPLFNLSRVFTDLGLDPGMGAWVPAIAGGLAAAAFSVLAQRESSEPLAIAALASVLVATVASLGSFEATEGQLTIVAGAGALGLQFAALSSRGRHPWSALTWAAFISEPFMAIATAYAFVGAGLALWMGETAPQQAGAVALFAAAWFVSDQRRRTPDCQSVAMALLTGGGYGPATAGLSICTAASVALATGSPTATGVTLAGLVVWLAFSGRARAHGIAPVAALVAVALMTSSPWLPVVGVVTAFSLAGAAAFRAPTGSRAGVPAWVLAVTALIITAATAGRIAVFDLDGIESFLAWLTFGGMAYAVGLISERFTTDPTHVGIGLLGRGVALLPTIVAIANPEHPGVAGVAIAVAIFTVIDAVRLKDNRFLAPLAFAATAGIATGLSALGLPLDQVGLGLTIVAATMVGLSLTSTGLDRPLYLLAGVSGVAGLAHASVTTGSLSTALIVLGAAGLMVAIDRTSFEGIALSSAVATVGLWTRLDISGVTWSEAYIAPLALALIVSGLICRDRNISSWITFGPAVALLGGAALIERVAGGAGAHSVIAGVIAVVAMIAGAERRLIAPLITGTVLLLAVTGHESLAYAASVPTWVWLAAAGTSLLGAGVFVERSATSPLETGRRAVDTIKGSYR